jgi:Leucine Rich repeat
MAHKHKNERMKRKNRQQKPIDQSAHTLFGFCFVFFFYRQLPDRSIAALYPVEDNYVLVEGNGNGSNGNSCSSLRSPKTLADLATDALCRSLCHLQGNDGLPAGLPQDVIDTIFASLLQHAALNATTLRALCSNASNCEALQTLSLANCRGVTDAWLEPLATSLSVSSQQQQVSASHLYDSSQAGPPDLYPVMMRGDDSSFHENNDGGCGLESMDLEEKLCGEDDDVDVFYHTFEMHPTTTATTTTTTTAAAGEDSSSCSTSSFVSANSHDDHHMTTMMMSPSLFHAAGDCNHHHHHHCNNTSMEEGMKMCNGIPDADSKQSADSSSPSTTRTTCSSLAATPPPSSPSSSYVAPSNMNSNNNLTTLDLRGSQRLTDRGLLQLAHCGLSRLHVARLDHCHMLQGRGLLCLAASHRTLHTLSLAHCRRLTDEAVVNISHIYSLQALSLEGCRCLTDRALAAMADLYHLTKLDLSQCDLITDRGLEMLQHLRLLQELSLGWCRQITDAGIDALTLHDGRAQNVKILRLARCTALTDVSLEHLQRLRALQELNLNGCSNMSSAALGQTLEKLPEMTTLDVSYCPGIL